jgi:hypothetical protein
VKKWPDALGNLRFPRSTEISQTLPTAVGIRHEKFQPFRFGERPGGDFFKAGGELLSVLEGM